MSNNQQAFLALVRAGLWEKEARLLPFGQISFEEIVRLAEEQSVLGLVSAGIEHVSDVVVPKETRLAIAGRVLTMEQRNVAMNGFIGLMIEKMRLRGGITTLLVKGQGIAQCYERPLWRACGDVDFFLHEENYEKAKQFLEPLASEVEKEGRYSKHLGMTIDGWVVELHGSLRGGLSSRINRVLDDIKHGAFYEGDVRVWMNGNTQVSLLGVDGDAVFVFCHILNHFYRGGVGLRQFCDWCRLLWTYRGSINVGLLEARLKEMGLVSVWKAFGAFAVEYLGMPGEAMPLYSDSSRMRKKAAKIASFVMEVGNMGHNRDNSYYRKYPYVIRKALSMGRRCGDLFRHALIFPGESLRFLPFMVFVGVRAAVRGE